MRGSLRRERVHANGLRTSCSVKGSHDALVVASSARPATAQVARTRPASAAAKRLTADGWPRTTYTGALGPRPARPASAPMERQWMPHQQEARIVGNSSQPPPPPSKAQQQAQLNHAALIKSLVSAAPPDLKRRARRAVAVAARPPPPPPRPRPLYAWGEQSQAFSVQPARLSAKRPPPALPSGAARRANSDALAARAALEARLTELQQARQSRAVAGAAQLTHELRRTAARAAPPLPPSGAVLSANPPAPLTWGSFAVEGDGDSARQRQAEMEGGGWGGRAGLDFEQGWGARAVAGASSGGGGGGGRGEFSGWCVDTGGASSVLGGGGALDMRHVSVPGACAGTAVASATAAAAAQPLRSSPSPPPRRVEHGQHREEYGMSVAASDVLAAVTNASPPRPVGPAQPGAATAATAAAAAAAAANESDGAEDDGAGATREPSSSNAAGGTPAADEAPAERESPREAPSHRPAPAVPTPATAHATPVAAPAAASAAEATDAAEADSSPVSWPPMATADDAPQQSPRDPPEAAGLGEWEVADVVGANEFRTKKDGSIVPRPRRDEIAGVVQVTQPARKTAPRFVAVPDAAHQEAVGVGVGVHVAGLGSRSFKKNRA